MAYASEMSGIITAARPAIIRTKVSRVRVPSRPIDLRSVAPATPVITSDTTRGITVIRMAFTQIVPIGPTQSAAARSEGLPLAAMAAPPARPAPRASRTRVLSFMPEFRGGEPIYRRNGQTA